MHLQAVTIVCLCVFEMQQGHRKGRLLAGMHHQKSSEETVTAKSEGNK